MTQNFFQTFILLLLVTDPFGNVPLFASVLNPVPVARRSRIVIRECAIAFVLLLVFMFFGRHFLSALQLSEVSLLVAIVRYRRIPVLETVAALYVEIIRGTPLLVVLFVTYFGLPALLGYRSTAERAAT